MRTRLAVLCVLVLAFPLAAAAAAPLTVVFKAPNHTPKVNTRWAWSVTASSGGKPVAGMVTAQVIDPIGGVHAVEFGGRKNVFVTSVKFKGRFADFVIYPPVSKGVKVTFRVTVKTALGKRVINWWAQAR
jgi:hypothetical protein